MKLVACLIAIVTAVALCVFQIGKIERTEKKIKMAKDRECVALIAQSIQEIEEVFAASNEKAGHEIFGAKVYTVENLRTELHKWSEDRTPTKIKRFDDLFFKVRMEMREAMKAYQAVCSWPGVSEQELRRKASEILVPDGWIEWSEAKHQKLDRIEGVKLLGNN